MARQRAREACDKIRQGVDLIAGREAVKQRLLAEQGKCITFEQAARAKFAAISAQFRNAKHRAQWISILERYSFPVLGSMDVADVKLAHVVEVLRPIWRTKTETATRVRLRIEVLLSWATVTGHRMGVNPAQWRGNPAEVLPKPAEVRKSARQSALPWRELSDFRHPRRLRARLTAGQAGAAACRLGGVLRRRHAKGRRRCADPKSERVTVKHYLTLHGPLGKLTP